MSRFVEDAFGPDPGLLRLRMAGRSVGSCALALVSLLGLQSLGIMPLAGIGLGFMMAIFGSMMVAEGTRREQAASFALLALPPLPSIALATVLSPWQWARDLGFVALAVLAILARQAGQRGMGMGMTAYIAYLMGAILQPKLDQLPLVLLAIPIGLLSAAAVRFVVLPDRPRQALGRAARDVVRRVPNVLEALLHDLDRDEGARPQRRPFRELARLNDAVLTADQQIQALPDQEKQRLRPVSDALFGLDLAAERTIRRVASQSLPLTHRDPVRQSLRLLRRRLLTGAGGPPESLPPACEPIASSLDALEQSVGRLQDALAAVA